MLNGAPVDWDGARNLADLGGLLLQDGQRTRDGVVFRSAATEWVTTEGACRQSCRTHADHRSSE